MQTSDIVNVVKKFPLIEEHFVGVFPLDKIPSSIENKSCLIFNKDTSDSGGSHWLCLIRTFNNNYEIFDSLGCQLSVIKPHLKFKKAVYFYNTNAFQELTSSTCGLFALYYLIHRMMNLQLSYRDLLSEIFCENKQKNENEVMDFFMYFVS